MTLNVRPVGDRILVEPVEEKEHKGKKGGIIIPDSAKEKPMESMVVAVGPGKTGDDGKKIFLEVKKGDRVLVSKYGGTEIKLDGKEYRIFNSDEVLAIIDN
jgi:chaperonin GroES